MRHATVGDIASRVIRPADGGMTEDGYASKWDESEVKSMVVMTSEKMKLMVGHLPIVSADGKGINQPLPPSIIGGSNLLCIFRSTRTTNISIICSSLA